MPRRRVVLDETPPTGARKAAEDARCANERCKRRSEPLTRNPVGRPRDFCSKACRTAQWAREEYARKKLAANPDRNEWYAPPWLRLLVMRFYNITLDVAASPESAWVPGNWLGPRHRDPARRDGLRANWKALAAGGIAWMNAPFDRRVLPEWVEKAWMESAAGLTVVALLPWRPRTRWWRQWILQPGVAVYEIPQRLKMEGPHSTGNGATFDMVIVVWDGSAVRDSAPLARPKRTSIFPMLPLAATFDPMADTIREMNGLIQELLARPDGDGPALVRAAFQQAGLPWKEGEVPDHQKPPVD